MAFIFPYAKRSIEEIDHEYIPYFSALVLCFTGLMGIAATGDAFNIFVLGNLLFNLCARRDGNKKGAAHINAYHYLIIGTIGGTFILLGIGFLYMMTGTLNIRELSTLLPSLNHTSTVRAAFAFMTVGASIKLALFPLHLWLPNTYTYAPSVVSAFLSSTATKVSYYVLLRTIFTLFGAAFVVQATQLKLIVAPLAMIAIFSGSINAIYQVNVKRLLAYSSVAQIGYMVLGLALNNVDGLTGGLIHLFTMP